MQGLSRQFEYNIIPYHILSSNMMEFDMLRYNQVWHDMIYYDLKTHNIGLLAYNEICSHTKCFTILQHTSIWYDVLCHASIQHNMIWQNTASRSILQHRIMYSYIAYKYYMEYLTWCDIAYYHVIHPQHNNIYAIRWHAGSILQYDTPYYNTLYSDMLQCNTT